MANDYTGTYPGIATGGQMRAADVTGALNKMEKVAYKVTALSASSTDTQYPSAKAVYDNLTLKENASNKVTTLSSTSTGTQYPSAKVVYDSLAAKQEKIASGTANNIVAYSGIAGTLNTLDRVTSVRAAASALDTAVPTEKAVAAALVAKANASEVSALSFFPKGTILMYDSQLWDRTGGITGWHICNGQDGTINLTDKFIRGGSVARQTGGTDTAQLLKHCHTFTGAEESGSVNTKHGGWEGFKRGSATGVFTLTDDYDGAATGLGGYEGASGLNFTMIPKGIIDDSGVDNPDNRPAFCTVIFIEKIV
ncbi:MAG: hypothetical protein LBQ83_06285 [Candidatus Margulisbacteria bacterium]|nr:hypothetical protein [Candidatus Margulisiibacteriota bacterium]